MLKKLIYKLDIINIFRYKIKKISLKQCIKKQYNLNYCFISFFFDNLKKETFQKIDNIYYCHFVMYKQLMQKLNRNQKIIILNNIHDCSHIYRHYWENNFNVLVLR